jgi:hypothetical protein
MAFWPKKKKTADRSEKILRCVDELRRVAASRGLAESEVVTALQTALGCEIAFGVRQRTHSPDQTKYVLDQVLDDIVPVVRETAYVAAHLPVPLEYEDGKQLTGDELKALANRIYREATRNNTPVTAALSATLKALGGMIGILAERPGVSADELIRVCQDGLAESIQDVRTLRASQKGQRS